MYFYLSFTCTGKSPSIWDHYFHKKANKAFFERVFNAIKENNIGLIHKRVNFNDLNHLNINEEISNGDIACDSYNLLDEDIKNLVDLKV